VTPSQAKRIKRLAEDNGDSISRTISKAIDCYSDAKRTEEIEQLKSKVR
jgi:hypothetical protein